MYIMLLTAEVMYSGLEKDAREVSNKEGSEREICRAGRPCQWSGGGRSLSRRRRKLLVGLEPSSTIRSFLSQGELTGGRVSVW